MHSKIIISDDFESVKQDIIGFNDPNFVRIFEYESFLIENAKEVINEAYITESREKIIVVMAFKFGIDPQNALLKILEEPPRNIRFIIVAKSKNLLLPTIRSRLMIEVRKKETPRMALELNLKRLNLKDIYNFIEEQSNLEKTESLSKNELLNLVKSIVCEAIEIGVKFKEEDYEYFYKLYRIVDLNTKAAPALTPLLLLIMQRSK